jgi:hypothetical protein
VLESLSPSGYYLENLYKGLKALLNLYKGLICNNFFLHSKRVLRRYHFHPASPKTQIEGSFFHFSDGIPRNGIPVGDISMAQHFQGSLLSTSPPSWLIGRENFLWCTYDRYVGFFFINPLHMCIPK